MIDHPSPQHSRAAIPLAPSLDPTLAQAHLPRRFRPLDRRVVGISVAAMTLGAGAACVAKLLTVLIGAITGLAFYGRWQTELVSPAGHHLGAWVIAVPVVGGLVVGMMARWGSRAIRGHGIPEAMEQILRNESRIPARMTWLKPVSSAVAIGTGGPFGAEGPIIATGGALGSLLGQFAHVTADERKTLLAAGAAGGMAAVFAAPISAVLLSIELLLFERRARSLIPVALAAFVGTGVRFMLEGSEPVFPMPDVPAVHSSALAVYLLLGALLGVLSVGITKLCYGIEDAFERLPVHWMWWPAIGGVAVGLIGYVQPATLGVGYDNITAAISGTLGLSALLLLSVAKLASWSIALGSGTSGGTLAPLFTIGSSLGGAIGLLVAQTMPSLHVDPRMAALVCMAALFAGASRALLTSVVFAFETTLQPHGLLPLLGGCAAAYLVSGLLMRNTIMTEKIVRRGVRVPSDFSADPLDRIPVGEACTRTVVSLRSEQTMGDLRVWLAEDKDVSRHQGFPVLDADGCVIGVLTRRNLFDASVPDSVAVGSLVTRPPMAVREDDSLREAADHMVAADVGRLVVLGTGCSTRMVGILTRGDLLKAHGQRLREARDRNRHLRPGR